MYEAPKLVRFGKFRDLTLQILECTSGSKSTNLTDSMFPLGIAPPTDGCSPRS